VQKSKVAALERHTFLGMAVPNKNKHKNDLSQCYRELSGKMLLPYKHTKRGICLIPLFCAEKNA
jgi:hypothetical protein